MKVHFLIYMFDIYLMTVILFHVIILYMDYQYEQFVNRLCISPGADSENLDFVAPLEEHRFYGISCYVWLTSFHFKNITPFKMCPKDPLRTISCS